jgi:ABC-2 type transport system permease protein
VTVFTGTGQLARLALRRDRVLLPLWIALFAAVAGLSAAATVDLYPTVDSRMVAAVNINRAPSLVALYGRVYDPTSLGAVALWKMAGFGTALVCALALVIVVRHTRAEEEHGRLELVGAAVVGRLAALTAALLVAVGACLGIGLLTAAALTATGLPPAGSLAFGMAWASAGIVFSAVAAVAAQITRGARAAVGITAAALGAAYLLRAVGDAAGDGGVGWLSWLSPIGLAQQVRAFAGERWWVFAVLVAVAIALTGCAYALAARRDLGAGLIADRPGPSAAAPGLRSPLALAWRLQRGALLAWMAAFAVIGLVLGNLAANVGGLLDSPQARELITLIGGEKGITAAFLAAELGIMGVIVSIYGVQAATRLRSEETGQRAEPVLATAVSRTSWACSHLAVALFGTLALLLTAGLAAGIGDALQLGDTGRLWSVVAGALVQFPAAAILIGIVIAAFGLFPRATGAGWAALIAFALLGEVGPLLKLDQWVMDLSPFAHVPKLPGGEVAVASLLWLTAIAAGLIAIGLAGFRRRDIG